MYDEIICRVPLPGTIPSYVGDGYRFQSKSLASAMHLYEITADRRLLHVEGWLGGEINEYVEGTFTVEFYTGNASGSYGGYTFTSAGEDYEWICYEASFINGCLDRVVQTEHKRELALPVAEMRKTQDVMKAEREVEIRRDVSEIGAVLYRRWGSISDEDKGYSVKLLAKTDREWALADEEGRIERGHPSDFGRLLFHSKEDAQKRYDAGKADQEAEWAYYKQPLEAKQES